VGLETDDTQIRPGREGGEATLLALAVADLAAERDRETILRRTVELTCAITGAEHAMLGLSDGSGDVGRVLTHGDPAALDRGHALSLPLLVGGRVVATLHLGGRERRFVGADTQSVSLLLRAAGIALGHLHEREEYAADRVARERSRIAAAIGELDQAAREIVEQGTRELGFAPHLRMTGMVALLPARLRGELLSALGEALAGIGWAPAARAVSVEVEASRRWLMLTVTDDGARRGTVGVPELCARGAARRRTQAAAVVVGHAARVAGAGPLTGEPARPVQAMSSSTRSSSTARAG